MTRRNTLKLRILTMYAETGWMAPAVWARRAAYSENSAYSKLSNLARYGLLERGQRRGRLIYRITDKGRGRLAWLSSRM